MNSSEIGLAILCGARFFARINNSLNRVVRETAINSHNIGGGNNDVQKVCEKIINLIQEKQDLVNITLIFKGVLNSIGEWERKILILKYVKNLDINSIALRVKKSGSSIRRILERGLNNYIDNFENLNCEEIKKIFKDNNKFITKEFLATSLSLAKKYEVKAIKENYISTIRVADFNLMAVA